MTRAKPNARGESWAGGQRKLWGPAVCDSKSFLVGDYRYGVLADLDYCIGCGGLVVEIPQ